MRIAINCLLSIILGAYICDAQQTISTTGGEGFGSEGTASYSVGLVVYKTSSGASGTESQGIQHAYEIFVITEIEETKGITLEISSYPNPTNDFLMLTINNFNIEYFTYKLFDIKGNLLKSGEILGEETVIPTGEYAPAVYLLQISNNQKEIKTFKIIKK